MNYKMIGKIISQIIFIEALFMIPALLICIVDRDWYAVKGFVVTLGIIALVSMLMYSICRHAERGFYAKEGLVCVGVSWCVLSLMGCLPFFLSGEIPNFVDALFETVSGFTTTGASILNDVEAMSRGMLYWRSFSHWIGGMGVLVLLLAVSLKDDKGNGFTMHLLRAESPGPNVGKLVPKMKRTAVILYLLYFALTIADFIFLLIGRMPIFDAVCTAFGTAGTGGFGIKNDSIASYSPYIQNVCTVFMLLFGVNFSCYYLLLLGRIKAVFKDEELRLYVAIVLGSIALITFNVWKLFGSFQEALQQVAFQVASIVTTTGFATTDFDHWPSFSKTIILMLMILGACAGSTGGGLKCGRALLIVKNLRRNLRKLLNPNRIEVVRNNGQKIDETVLNNTNTYLAAYAIIILLSLLIVSLDGLSMESNISAVISCFNNIGPGFDTVGPTCNFAVYGIPSKIILILDMLSGRLEIFPMLVLFSKTTWKHR